MDIIDRLKFDAAQYKANYPKGIALNIEEAITAIERLRAALVNLYDYCEDHDWGSIPVGKTIEAAEDLVRELRPCR